MSANKVEAICKNYTEDADEPVKRITYQNVLDVLQDHIMVYNALIIELESITDRFIPKDVIPKSNGPVENDAVPEDYMSLIIHLNTQLFYQNSRMTDRILLLESISV